MRSLTFIPCFLFDPDVFFAFPHIAVSSTGVWGEIKRFGIAAESHACGALDQIRKVAKAKTPVNSSISENDVEISILTRKLLVDTVCSPYLVECQFFFVLS